MAGVVVEAGLSKKVIFGIGNSPFWGGVFTLLGRGIQLLGQGYSGVFEGIRGYSTLWGAILAWQAWHFRTMARDTAAPI